MIFAAIMVGLGTLMAQMADKMTAAPAASTSPPTPAVIF
jgi:aspartyl protease family protein